MPSDRSTRHIEVQLPAGISYRVGDHLSVVPRNDPALVDSVARRFGFLPADQIRLQVAEGRRAQLPVGDAVSVGRLLTRFRRVAAGRDPQADPDHVGAHALPGDEAETAGLCRRRRRRHRTLPHATSWASANRCLTCWRSIRPANCRSMPIWKCCRCWRRAIIRSRPRRRAIPRAAASPSAWSRVPASSGRGIYKGICSNYLAGRRAGETIHATVRETKAGFRLPDDAVRADHHDRPRHGSGAVPRLPAGARGAQGQGRDARPGDAVFRLPPSRSGFSLRRRTEGVRGRRHHRTAHRVLARARVRRPMCRIWSRRRRTGSGA